MRPNRLVIAAALTLVTLVAATATGRATTPTSRSDGSAAEVRRIRTHFDSVLAGLASRDLSALTQEQRARRASLMNTLRAYQARGVFPHNYDFPGQDVPYFVDRKTGTLCAVAHLLASTGRGDIVDRVAQANNNVWVPQLAGDSAFTHWLGDNGITLDDAAFIQVPYTAPVSNAEVARNVGFVAATPFALGGAVTASLMNGLGNADGHRTVVSKLGVVSGIATVAIASTALSKDVVGPTLGVSTVALGLTSVALSIRSMRNHSTIMAAREAEKTRTMAQTAVVPIVDMSNGGSAGFAVTMRF